MARMIARRKPPEELMPLAVNYAQNRGLRERAEGEEKKYKDQLMAILTETGQEVEGGHKVIDLPESVPLGKKVMVGMKRQRRASQLMAEDRAEKYLKQKGLWEQCTTTITVINEDAILALNFSGEITDKDLKALYDEKETFAFYPMYEGE